MKKKPVIVSDEARGKAVSDVLNLGQSKSSVARRLGVHPTTVGGWVAQAKPYHVDVVQKTDPTTDKRFDWLTKPSKSRDLVVLVAQILNMLTALDKADRRRVFDSVNMLMEAE